VGGAAAHGVAHGHGEAQVRAVTVGGGAGVPAALARRVEHQDVQHELQLALGEGGGRYTSSQVKSMLFV